MGMSRSEAGKLGYQKTKDKLEAWKIRRRKRAEEKAKNNKCGFCGEKISYEKRKNKFCNHSCAAKHHNPERVKEDIYCLNCGDSVDRSRGKKYCSSKCSGEHRVKQSKDKIRETGVALNARLARRYLKEAVGINCTICGITKWNDREVPLVLDHINGNPYDWRIINLRLICPNCDAQTDTYKGKNRGKGRWKRRQRYKDGKSY